MIRKENLVFQTYCFREGNLLKCITLTDKINFANSVFLLKYC